ncbi:MAG: peptidyl-prolyl cis-trans isomerase [Polyangiaceae bacterium]|nr:peptidyl-prolyl cis-trans isomerase [Polyangiaceae bacterium]
MSAQGVTSEEALERVVRDALFSAHARAQPPLRDRARGVEQAMLARVLLEQFRREAEARPVTDDDIRAAMAERFLEFDRPPMVKVIHAVVRFTAPGDEPRARTVADAIRRAVVDVKDEAAFRSAASAVPNDGFEVAIEALAPLAADGRVAPGRGMVEPFARAAHAIASIGGTSPVTRTKYGLHVIRLIERQPALFVPVAEARPRLEASVRTARLREAYDGLVRGLAAREPSTIDPASGELMGLIDLEL